MSVLAVWAILFTAAWASRSQALKLAWFFLMLAPLPVAFIPPRGAPQYYVAIFGWALYAAAAFAGAVEYLLKRLPKSLQLDPPESRATVMVAACALMLFPFYRNSGFDSTVSVSLEGEQLRQMNAQMHRLYPQVKPAARMLFLNDPVEDDYRLLMLSRLTYNDVGILVDRGKVMHPPPGPKEIAAADYVFDYHAGRFYNSPQPAEHGPAIEFEWGRPSVFHRDLKPITPSNPAAPGETIIAEVTDLGATDPPLPAGQLFPQDPLLEVAGPVAVRVGDTFATVSRKIGWPGSVNYRIDFPLPSELKRGDVMVQVIVGSVAGPEVSIPVE
jgi:hypothetical protein